MCEKCGKWWNYHIFEKQNISEPKNEKNVEPFVDMNQWLVDKAEKEKKEKKNEFEELIEEEDRWEIIKKIRKNTEDQEVRHNVSEIKELSPQIKNGISKEDIKTLSGFQINSIKKILEGKSTVISAPTASGKTEAFLIPILQKILQDKEHKGTFCVIAYPTKALAADQVGKINTYAEACGLGNCARRLDGDLRTGPSRDAIIEKHPKIIVTTIDFIHWHLASQDNEAEIFKEPKIFVLDEAHSYSGFFGSNVYFILKRLKKFLKNTQFIAASATLDNALEFCQELFDEQMELVIGRSRKKSIKQYVIQPTKINHLTASKTIAQMFIQTNNQFLSFHNSRKDAEGQAYQLKENKFWKVKVHRAGISNDERTITEREMKDGDLDGICCTTTLELGIDIGSVTGVSSILTNDLDSFIQREGRAGRQGNNAYSVMILKSKDAISHYYRFHIEEYFAQKNILHIQKENPVIKKWQEKFEKADSKWALIPSELKKYNVRGMGESVGAYEGDKRVDLIPYPAANTKLFPGAIHMANSRPYVSKGIKERNYKKRADLQYDKELAYWETTPEIESEYHIDETYREKILRNIKIQYCKFKINSSIKSYYKWNISHEAQRRTSEDNLIPMKEDDFVNWNGEYTGIKIEFLNESKITKEILHTASHLIQNAGCKIAKCESDELDEIIDSSTIIIYDNTANQTNGNSQIIYEKILEVFDAAIGLVRNCKCHYEIEEEEIGDYKKGEKWNKETGETEEIPWPGCPLCTFLPSGCKKFNEELDKMGAYEFLINCTISDSSDREQGNRKEKGQRWGKDRDNSFYDNSFSEDEEAERNYQEEFNKKYEKYNDDGGSSTGKCRRCGRFNDSYTHSLCENCELEDFLSMYSVSEREQYRRKARRIIHEERRYDNAEYERRYYKKYNRKKERKEQKEERKEQKEDYYKILGVSETANLKEIKDKWRELAKKYHPDKITPQLRKELKEKEGKSAEEKFSEISEAYEILRDEMKRRYRQSHAN